MATPRQSHNAYGPRRQKQRLLSGSRHLPFRWVKLVRPKRAPEHKLPVGLGLCTRAPRPLCCLISEPATGRVSLQKHLDTATGARKGRADACPTATAHRVALLVFLRSTTQFGARRTTIDRGRYFVPRRNTLGKYKFLHQRTVGRAPRERGCLRLCGGGAGFATVKPRFQVA